MAGKEYSAEAYRIGRELDEMASAAVEGWRDEQAKRFGYEYMAPVRQALSDMQLPIEAIVDLVDLKLKEIQEIANGK